MIVEVDTSRFDAMCDELKRLIDAPDDRVFREEVGAVLSKAIDNTHAATVAAIKHDSSNARFSMLPASVYAPKRPGRRHLTSSGRVKYNLKYRYPQALWDSIQKHKAISLARRLKARGLAKQSFYKIGEMLGLAVDAPAYVKRAKATTGREYTDEKVAILREKGVLEYDIETSQPTLLQIGGEKALQKAIDGRVLYFLNNLGRDVFNRMSTIAKKYPGVTVTKNG